MVGRALGAALMAALPATTWGQVKLGSEFQVNTITIRSQQRPTVAADAAGNFVVTWIDYEHPTGYVVARRYDASGTPRDAAEFPVSSPTHRAHRSVVSSGQNGNFVVFWSTVSNQAVFARTYDASGAAGPEFEVADYFVYHQTIGGVACDAVGNFVVAWDRFEDYPSGMFDVFARRYDADGTPRGSMFEVNSHTEGYQYVSSVASDRFGNFVVAWVSEIQEGRMGDVYAQRYDAAGAALGAEFRVNTSTVGLQWPAVTRPAVASDLDGRFVVVWDALDGSDTGIFGQRYDSSGTPQGGEFRVNTVARGAQSDPAVSADANGFVVAWTSFAQDGSANGVIARRYHRNGTPVGAEFVVNTYTTQNQQAPSVASAQDGSFVVTWQSYGQDGDAGGVFAQLFASDLIFGDGFELRRSAPPAPRP